MYQTPYTLLNFNCPNYLKQDIDQICKFRRISRTALINTFFKKVVEEWKPRLIEKAQNQSTLPSKVKPHSLNWSVTSPRQSPVTDYGEPLVILSNEQNNDW